MDGSSSEKTFSKKIADLIKEINVEVPLFLYMLASFLHQPVFQSIVYDKCCYSVYSSSSVELRQEICSNSTASHNDPRVQTMANHLLLYSNLCQTLTSIAPTILLGTFGDRRSRKLAMLLPFVGVILADVNYIVQASSDYYNVYLLLLSDAVFGLAGGYSTIIGTIFSYGAERTSLISRSYRMAVLEGTIGLGGTFGYLLSGYVLSKIGYEAVFLIELVLHCLAFFFIIAFVPDIKRHDSVTSSSSSDGTILYWISWIWIYVKDAGLTVVKQRFCYGRRIVVTIFVSFTFSYLVFSGSSDIMFYYLKDTLNWTTNEYGYFSGFSYGTSTLTVLLIYPFLKRFCNFGDPLLAGIGVSSRLLACLMMSYPFNTNYIFSSLIFYMFNRFASAGMRSIISKETEKNEQGKIFAAIALLESLCGLIASAIFNVLFPVTLNWFPGFSYVLMACFMLIPLSGLFYVQYCTKRNAHAQVAHSDAELLTSSSGSANSEENENDTAERIRF